MHKREEAMQQNREGAAAANGGPTKRLRRPSIRFNQPYYVNPTHRNLQQKWDSFKKDLEGAKKARQTRGKMNVVDEIDDDDDDDLAIGNWKNFNLGSTARKLNWKEKRKRGEDREKEESSNLSGSESEKEGATGEDDEAEENLGADGVNRNLEIVHSSQSSPSTSLPNEKSSDGEKQGKIRRKLRNGDEIRAIGGKSDGDRPKGVKIWLNELGLGKYESLFEVHEVDEEVLPFLTLEDLKDMGINAVGSRRKMYRSIQKLGKGFS